MGFKYRIKTIQKLISVTELLEKKGIDVEPGNRMSCPIHDGDNSTSFHIKLTNRNWRCYSCGRWGSVVDLAKYLYDFENLEEAIDHLEEILGIGGDDLKSIHRRLTMLTKEEQDTFSRKEYFSVVTTIIDELLIESRPNSVSLRSYYFMIMDEMQKKMMDVEILTSDRDVSDDMFREYCSNILAYARQFIPFYWGCVRQHLIVMRRLYKEVRPNESTGKLLCKMVKEEYEEHINGVRGDNGKEEEKENTTS